MKAIQVVLHESMKLKLSFDFVRNFCDCHCNCVLVVEDLMKKRQPMPTFDAVYFITPTQQSVKLVIDDFSGKRKYNHAHLFFTDCKKLWCLSYIDFVTFDCFYVNLFLMFILI